MRTRAVRRSLALASVFLVAVISVLSPARAAPANDDFAAATSIADLPFAAQVDTTGATTEGGEPNAFDACASAGASVWYSFVPATDQRLAASTRNSGFDATVGIYSGSSLNDLTLMGCGRSPFFTANAGETYWFQIGGSTIDNGGNLVDLTGLANFTLDFLAPVPAPCAGCPAFRNYKVSDEEFTFALHAGETSIGYDRKKDAAMFLMGLHTLNATWDASDEIAWKQVDGLTTSRQSNDPILWTDPATSRTFVAQLQVAAAAGGSIIEYTDDGGATWQEAMPGQVNPSWDHQTIGGGPYPAALNAAPHVYPNALYYCAQLGSPFSQCTRSDNGGVTWGAPLPMNILNCDGLHGHIAVGPDGTVYVPHKSCNGTQGIVYSTDAGTTWGFRPVPGTKGTGPYGSDPKIAFDDGGRMYFSTESDGHPVTTTSTDGGKTWGPVRDVGAKFGIRNAEFSMNIAGDAGRAAMAFYGTPSDGSDQAADFPGEWHLYVATTYDGGDTWTTVDTTPNDPVQRGCIWLQGGSNPCRNLLDFQDMTMDNDGRVIVGYADGCYTSACTGVYGTYVDSQRGGQGVLTRQTSGKTLRAAFDGHI